MENDLTADYRAALRDGYIEEAWSIKVTDPPTYYRPGVNDVNGRVLEAWAQAYRNVTGTQPVLQPREK